MEDSTMLSAWQSYNQKLNEVLQVNKKLLIEIQQQKVKSALNSVKGIKIFGIIIGILWVIFLMNILINDWHFLSIFFIVSVIIHLAVSLTAFAFYVYHFTLIHEIENTESVILSQEKLAKIQSSTIWVYKISFLQLPVFETWYMSLKWMHDSPATFWFIQVPIVLLFTFFGIWLYKNININNKNKWWLRFIFRGNEFANITKASDFLNEIEDYKH